MSSTKARDIYVAAIAAHLVSGFKVHRVDAVKYIEGATEAAEYWEDYHGRGSKATDKDNQANRET